MRVSLCGNIQFSSSSFKLDDCYLHPSLVEKGWREFLRTRIETIKRVRPRVVFMHTGRGLKPRPGGGKAMQNFAQRRLMREAANPKVRLLEETLDVYHECVREIQAAGVMVISYEGVPSEDLRDLDAESLWRLVENELCDPATRQFTFDGAVIDGASNMMTTATAVHHGVKPDARGLLADAIDGYCQPRFRTGNEAQAVAGRSDLMHRPQFTLAGEYDTADPTKWKMRTGSFDPEHTVVRNTDAATGATRTQLHGKFEPLKSIEQGGGDHYVLDLFDPGKDLERYKARQRRIAELGCHVVMQVENMDRHASWIGEGLRLV